MREGEGEGVREVEREGVRVSARVQCAREEGEGGAGERDGVRRAEDLIGWSRTMNTVLEEGGW